ncbi:MAG: phosphate/phosphite/phosphonate ABC transporter substrate-binding protein [Candidatus Brocadiales bacterium]
MRRIIVLSLILSLCFVLTNAAHGQGTPKKNVLTMGRVSDKALKEQKQIEPIITYLASKLEDVGIERGEVVLMSDNDAVIEYLRKDKLDIVLETPFSAYLYKVEANVTPVLLAWRKGAGEYNSLIFVRKDSGIRRLEDLKGKVIAFEDPGSTSAYFLPMFSIKAKGLNLVEIESFDSPVPEGKIGYVFAGSELNISGWVFFNNVDAGALSSTDWNDQGDNPRAYRKEFKIIYETQKVPRMLVAVRKGLDKKLVERIKEELLKMDKGEEGRKALKGFKVKRFLELPGRPEDVLKPIEDLLIRASAEKLR